MLTHAPEWFVTTASAGNVPRYREHLDKNADVQALIELFKSLNTKLNQELQRIECAPEPNWRPIPIP